MLQELKEIFHKYSTIFNVLNLFKKSNNRNASFYVITTDPEGQIEYLLHIY